MKFIFWTLLTVSLGLGSAFAANGKWEPPKLSQCKAGDHDCKTTNYCLSSSTEGCIAHVGDRANQDGGQYSLNRCFDERMLECMKVVFSQDGDMSTNPTDNPDPWNCKWSNTAGKASDKHCRIVNYCLDTGAQICSEQIGSNKYKPDGKEKMYECSVKKEIACMRVLD